MEKYLIIGGVAAGMSAAVRLRRLDETAEITVLERGDHISYANCGLPYYIGDVITERDNLLLQTPEAIKRRFNIEVRTGSEAIGLDPVWKVVKVRDLSVDQLYDQPYDKLLLAPGGSPAVPPIPGIDHPAIRTLWTIPDTDRIRTMVDSGKVKTALVIGAGFIGLEMAENLHARGIAVTVVEMADQAMTLLDYEMAALVQRELMQQGVQLKLREGVTAFATAQDGSVTATLTSGSTLTADLVLLSIGTRPNTAFLAGSGIALGVRGHILVNEKLQTNLNGVYAAGDAIEVINPLTGKSGAVPLAGPANKQGRIAADNMHGATERSYRGTMGTAIAKIFDLDVGMTGLTEKQCQAAGIACATAIIHPNDHAGYYPGAAQFTLKLVYSPEARLVLGAQAVGFSGVDKRIDIIATALKGQMTVDDLTEIEHAYAPPYSSAKDPVNMVGFVAQNNLDGLFRSISWDELAKADRASLLLLDVRTAEEFATGSIDGAVNIPLDELRQRLSELRTSRPIVIFCKVGLRGYLAARLLQANGFADCRNLSGGLQTWLAATSAGIECRLDNNTANERGEQAMAVSTTDPQKVIEVNACGQQCPGPVMRLKVEIDAISPGEAIAITASDPGFYTDVKSWANATGNILREITSNNGVIRAVIEKGSTAPVPLGGGGKDKTIIVFSGDLDKALASFVIANGALAMDRQVTMFFTFWGLNVLRRSAPVSIPGKNLIEKAFGFMMPRGSARLSLSRMSMAGMGDALIRRIMKEKQVPSLEEMIESAIRGGARLVACQMSMELMGIRQEELIDGIEIGGVAAYLEASERADNNLFI